MISRIILGLTLLILTYGFWIIPQFSEMGAGIAIFLFGILFLKNGFLTFSGGLLEKILQKCTDKTYKSLLFGFFASTILQSSTLVTIITISFLSAELITLVQGIGIIFGSSIGTTTTAWLVAGIGMKVNLGIYAMPLLVFGIIFTFQKSRSLNGFGTILAGLGFIFLGIHFMKLGFEAFNEVISFKYYSIEGYYGFLIFILIGIIICALLQSSTATIILVIAAYSLGEISYENSLGIVIGANIGTTMTGMIGSLAGNINAKRLSIADFSFKLFVGIIFTIFIYPIIDFIDFILKYLSGPNNNYSLNIALFHTLYSTVGVLLLTPFIKNIANILTKTLKDTSDKNYIHFKYLDYNSLNFPETALSSINKETKRIYDIVKEIFFYSFGLKDKDFKETYNYNSIKSKIKLIDIDEIEKLYIRKLKYLYGEVIEYIIKSEINNSKTFYESFSNLKTTNRRLISTIKNFKNIQYNTNKYLISTNIDIKKQYESIIKDIIETFLYIDKLYNIEDYKEKVKYMAELELMLNEKNILNNNIINNLIRENKINKQMSTSLLNDIYYKNKILKDLIKAVKVISYSELIKNDEDLYNNVKKLSYKLRNRKIYIIKLLKNLNIDIEKKKKLENELNQIKFIIKSNKKIYEDR